MHYLYYTTTKLLGGGGGWSPLSAPPPLPSVVTSLILQLSLLLAFCFRRHVVLNLFCVILSVHCYCHVTTTKSDENIGREILMFPNQGFFQVTMLFNILKVIYIMH